jgi:acetate kinase
MRILVLNAGSSSQKSRLYELGESVPDLPQEPLWEADADWSEQQGETHCKITTSTGQSLEVRLPTTARHEIITHLLETLWSGKTAVISQPSEIDIVGHRIVHGGQEFRESVEITPNVKEAIQRLSAFAPLHNPLNLEGIEAVEHVLPHVPQVAVFDTAFHSQLPLEAVVYPGPYEWFEQGIRRYGFHGISHQYCAQRAAQILERDLQTLRLVTCHIGNGCSLAAIQGGRSIDTTMGFTPLEGLMMGSRSGSIDPGILIYLLRQKGYSADQFDTMLNTQSGLKGVSGKSGDMRAIHAAIEQGDERARLALAIYVHRLRAGIGAMITALGGLDALVFAGGVGENDAGVRADVCETFTFLGLRLDAQKNAKSPSDQVISATDSAVRVLIVQTQEDWSIARECWKIAKG